jgi:hypothetical protein
MRGLLIAQGAAKNARETQHCAASAGETVRSVVLADQLTLNAKHCRLQFDKTDVLMGELFCHVAGC